MSILRQAARLASSRPAVTSVQHFSISSSQQLNIIPATTTPTDNGSSPRRRKAVPPPTAEIPDVTTFLTKIGRGTLESVGPSFAASESSSSWQDLMTLSSYELKQKGIETRTRRYILSWREKFTKGEPVVENKRGKKSWGGERRRKANKAEFVAMKYRKEHRERMDAEAEAKASA